MDRTVTSCICGHSRGAHSARGQGRCGLCSCTSFAVKRPARRPAPDQVVTLRQASQRLGLGLAVLRGAIRQGLLHAIPSSGGLRIRLQDGRRLRNSIEVVPSSRKARARLAQAVAFQDFLGRLWQDRSMVREPLRAGFRTTGQAAAQTELDRQLRLDGRPPLLPRAKRARARRVEESAIEDMVRHLPRHSPPERSL